MKLPYDKQFRFMMTLFLIFVFIPSVSISSSLLITRTPSTGYQPQFQVSGTKIYYVWREDHGPTEPIWVAIDKLK
jgi:hypothetical protein